MRTSASEDLEFFSFLKSCVHTKVSIFLHTSETKVVQRCTIMTDTSSMIELGTIYDKARLLRLLTKLECAAFQTFSLSCCSQHFQLVPMRM